MQNLNLISAFIQSRHISELQNPCFLKKIWILRIGKFDVLEKIWHAQKLWHTGLTAILESSWQLLLYSTHKSKLAKFYFFKCSPVLSWCHICDNLSFLSNRFLNGSTGKTFTMYCGMKKGITKQLKWNGILNEENEYFNEKKK